MEEIGIESTLVEAIRNGDKTIEAVLGEPRYLRIQEDDLVSIREDFWYEGNILESLTDALKVKVTHIIYFETFEEMLTAVDFQAVIPHAKSVDEAVKVYKELYSSQDLQEFGVVALTFELA